LTTFSHLVKFALVNLKQSDRPIIRRLSDAAFRFLKYSRNLALKPQYFYECYIAKFLSLYFFFLYKPLIAYAKRKKIRFLVNVAPSVGHTTLEIDNFFRRLHLKELDPEHKYVIIVKYNSIFRDFFSLYKNRFHQAQASTLLYNLLLPFFLREKELTVDAGVSRLKWQLFPPGDPTGVTIRGRPFHFQLHLLEGNAQTRFAYERRKLCANYLPLAIDPCKSQPLLEKLKLQGQKLCLVHLKTNIMNATAACTDPKTYLPALEMLFNQGFRIVFVGREKMPEEFARFGTVNYSQSRHATFKHDILLFQACEMAIVGGSGIAFLAQCYGKPFLYLNSWHAGLSPFTEASIFIPALVRNSEGRYLSFWEQNDLYFKLQAMDEQFPLGEYSARNADGEEILESAKELLDLMNNRSPRSFLQERYMSIDQGKGVLEFSLSRISNHFIERHQHLLADAET